MKKLSVFVISVLLIVMMVLSVSAATPNATLAADMEQVKVGQEVTVTLSFSDVDAVSSAYAVVTTPENMELISGEWVAESKLAEFSANQGVIAFKNTSVSGNVLKLVFKGKTASAVKDTVKVAVTAKNGGTEVLNTVASVDVQVICATHSFSDWTVTKEANCTEAGSKNRVCSVCAVSETEVVSANGHQMGSWTRTKKPTCTAAGEDVRTCKNCTHKETSAVAMVAHSYGAYEVTVEATCEEKGVETSTCAGCGKKITREVALKEHTYGQFVVVRPATESEVGLQTKTCSACGDVIEAEIPMLDKPAVEPTEEPSVEPTKDTEPTDVPVNDAVEKKSDSIWDALWILGVLSVVALVAILVLVKKKK